MGGSHAGISILLRKRGWKRLVQWKHKIVRGKKKTSEGAASSNSHIFRSTTGEMKQGKDEPVRKHEATEEEVPS